MNKSMNDDVIKHIVRLKNGHTIVYIFRAGELIKEKHYRKRRKK